ncbi:MAG: hypothetical protein AMS27_18370 [Bacteroides sp. SM23_62_1]|nr:MAG: hypothetical protein AMS27_18370 [Bacteroides sp. SM23_62_1]
MLLIFLSFVQLLNAQFDIQSRLHFSFDDSLFKAYPGLYLSALRMDQFSCHNKIDQSFKDKFIYFHLSDSNSFTKPYLDNIPPDLIYTPPYNFKQISIENYSELSMDPWGNRFGWTLFFGKIHIIGSKIRNR